MDAREFELYLDLEAHPDLVSEFGVEPGWRFAMIRRARFSDLDSLAHLNHTAFLRYFEDARLNYLRLHGLPPPGIDTPAPVLARLEVEYKQPAFHGDRILVTTRLASMRNTSFVLEYAAWTQGCACAGNTLCVLMVAATGEKIPIPPTMRESVAAFEGKSF